MSNLVQRHFLRKNVHALGRTAIRSVLQIQRVLLSQNLFLSHHN